jgi:hypothetical protein
MGGEAKASQAALEALTGQESSNRRNSIAPFLRDLRGAASIFVLTPDGFKRILTTAVNETGQSAIGTLLAKDHPAHALLLAGKGYVGPARVFGRQYQTSYTLVLTLRCRDWHQRHRHRHGGSTGHVENANPLDENR